MNRHLFPIAVALLFVMTLCAEGVLAQKVVPAPNARLSPLAVAAKKLSDGTYVKIVYGSPQRRNPENGENRVVFGTLVPYGKVWRLGANESTEITTTGDIELGGKRVPAGTYSVFAVPGEREWTIVLNKDLGMWGEYTYKEANDFLRFTVPVQKSADTYDAFTISFNEPGTEIGIVWENTRVVIPVKPL